MSLPRECDSLTRAAEVRMSTRVLQNSPCRMRFRSREDASQHRWCCRSSGREAQRREGACLARQWPARRASAEKRDTNDSDEGIALTGSRGGILIGHHTAGSQLTCRSHASSSFRRVKFRLTTIPFSGTHLQPSSPTPEGLHADRPLGEPNRVKRLHSDSSAITTTSSSGREIP